MKVSYNWLKELLPDLSASPEEVAEILTMHSFETEVTKTWQIDATIKIVKITAINPHPNADRLRLATVTDGQQEIQVVCGAPNITVGQLVPYAPPGATVVDKEGQPFTLTDATIRGVKSPGMLNSARELNISDDHGGILILPPELPVGDPLMHHLPSDTILEADITPNRAHDCLSHVGIARELATLLKLTVKEPPIASLTTPTSAAADFSLDIDPATTSVLRYDGLVLQNINSQSSPPWMQARLLAVGARPIHPLVDITNYVLFETGQPSHAFDADQLPGSTISVRTAHAGEKLVLLNQDTLEPTADDLVITSNDQPVALAGVMGGRGTQVGETTNNIFLEVATFPAFSIQETARRLNLRSESSLRFAKELDSNLVEVASARLVHLIQDICGGTLAGRLQYYPHPRLASVISFRPERSAQIAGAQFDHDEIKDVLIRLRCVVDDTSEVWSVTPPTDRLDLNQEHDLVEEIIRVAGLTNIPATNIQKIIAAEGSSLPPSIYWREAVRDLLVESGFTETYNQSFEPAAFAKLLDLSEQSLELINPPAPELKHLRRRLLPGLLANLATNRDDFHKKFSTQEKALFEIGHVYQAGEGGLVPGVLEEVHVAGILVGTAHDIASILDSIRQLLQIETFPTPNLSPSLDTIQKKLKFRVPIVAFEFNLTELIKHAPEVPQHRVPSLQDLTSNATINGYQPFSRYPSILRDVAFLVEPSVTVEQAQEVIERVGGQLVLDTDLFDEFEPAGENRKNLAFHIEYQSLDKTLTDSDIEPVHQAIIKALQTELQAEIR